MNPPSDRGLWVACCLLLSAVVSIIGGLLSYADGANLAGALATGGAAFLATGTLGLAVLAHLDPPR
ncbi:hypothetical protein [Asanoa iriomotensis]|uniref:Uncharacterized protein n=1 Tax=Asanoa iriomotensis TaxID=234613 RepID=A0ABQ4BVV8_9ACTN|nr:hypothetical protein [Asanoa iriomotensis]GIF54661.1 hypothetical protein Air01nite_07560 [Asanoa iriomotensis]